MARPKAPAKAATRPKAAASKPRRPERQAVAAVPARVRRVSARYDAAQTTSENRRHWALADGLSADAAASPGVRKILRDRARYEVANNGYAEGMVGSLANDCIGTGPHLRMLGLTNLAKDVRSLVEGEFAAWMRAADIGEKLRTARAARSTDGEAFGIIISNPELDTPVKLDLRLIEAEQVTAFDYRTTEPNTVDGISFDAYGNPVEYTVLAHHPGSTFFAVSREPIKVPASNMLHLFVAKRPGQRRGVCELTPALPLFSQLRRFTMATLAAAETAADFAAIMRTQNAPEDGAVDSDPFDEVEIAKRMITTLPAGWMMEQLKAEHPGTTYDMFKREIIGEAARALQMPINVALGDSSKHNYASGRLDHQNYAKAKRVDRERMRAQALDRLFFAWRREAVLIEGYLPQTLRTVQTDWSHVWMWEGDEHVDPAKEANAQATRLASQTASLANECAKQGLDWEEHLEQLARENDKRTELGLPVPGMPAPLPPDPTVQDGQDQADQQDGETDEVDAVEATTILRDAAGVPTGIVRETKTRRPLQRARAKASR